MGGVISRPEVRGDIARIYFYMADRYALSYPPAFHALLQSWSEADPVSSAEKDRNSRIENLQGHANRYVSE